MDSPEKAPATAQAPVLQLDDKTARSFCAWFKSLGQVRGRAPCLGVL